MPRRQIKAALVEIFAGIARLTKAFPHRSFTIDGRLVGDIGEIIASLEYDVALDKVQRRIHDACTPDGRNVQIKATFKESLTFGQACDYYLGLKLHANGEYDEIYNGPIGPIRKRYGARKGFGVKLLSFPIKQLRNLSAGIKPEKRIRRRRGRRS